MGASLAGEAGGCKLSISLSLAAEVGEARVELAVQRDMDPVSGTRTDRGAVCGEEDEGEHEH